MPEPSRLDRLYFDLVDRPDLNAVVAANIKRVAKRRGIGLNELADISGVSRSQLYAVLAASSSATIDWLFRVASALDVEVWELLRR